jgi:hypothetical protein
LDGIDAAIDGVFQPMAKAPFGVVFYSVEIGDAEVPLIVVWLIAGATFFTFYLGFINLRGFVHALRLTRGDFDDPGDPAARGEVSHFQANQAYVQTLVVTGGDASPLVARGWLFGVILAGLVALVAIAANAEKLPAAIEAIVMGAFTPDGVAGECRALVPDSVGHRRRALRLLDDDLLVVVRPCGVVLPGGAQSRLPEYLQGDLLRVGGGGVYGAARERP